MGKIQTKTNQKKVPFLDKVFGMEGMRYTTSKQLLARLYLFVVLFLFSSVATIWYAHTSQLANTLFYMGLGFAYVGISCVGITNAFIETKRRERTKDEKVTGGKL